MVYEEESISNEGIRLIDQKNHPNYAHEETNIIETHSFPSESDTSRTTSSEVDVSSDKNGGGTSVSQTSMNIVKMCMGTGTLALPYAASQAGYIFSALGLAAITIWNLYTIDRLLKCVPLLPSSSRNSIVSSNRNLKSREDVPHIIHVTGDAGDKEEERVVHPPAGTSTFGRVVWYAIGPIGLQMFDAVFVVLFCGIIVAYQDAATSFIVETPINTGSDLLNGLTVFLIVLPLSCLPDLGFLGKFSAMGVYAIVLTFVVIFGYGFSSVESVPNVLNALAWDTMWPENLTQVSNWFGVVCLTYGMTPITFNIQQSMAQPQKIMHATSTSFLFVFIASVLISNGLAILLSPGGHSFQGDVLHYLPSHNWISTGIRLTMTLVVVVSMPLLVMPTGELVEGKLRLDSTDWKCRVITRSGICLVCCFLSILQPEFVSLISFIGCSCMALVSFALPPLCYILLSIKKRERDGINDQGKMIDLKCSGAKGGIEAQLPYLKLEVILFIWGMFASVVSSYLSFMSIVEDSR